MPEPPKPTSDNWIAGAEYLKQLARAPAIGDQLTDMQKRTVRLLSLGCSVAEAARILGISPNTADNHKTRAMRALGIHKTALLTRYAIAKGISPLDDKLTLAERKLLSS
jgi:DNA-binding CsgD family transcriptional regulator